MEPYWQSVDGRYTVYCGDALAVLPTLIAESVDLVITSPPYDTLRDYHGYSFDFQGVVTEITRVLSIGGVLVWVVGDATVDGSETLTSMKQAIYFKDICGLNVHDTMIYEKINSGGARGSNLAYWQAFEFMFVFAKGKPITVHLIKDRQNVRGGALYCSGGRRNADGSLVPSRQIRLKEYGKRTNIWRLSPQGHGQHPAPFPEALPHGHILSWSNPGGIILDPFCGSGTTGVACIRTNRRFIGIEISEEYCHITRKRLDTELRQLSLLTIDTPPAPVSAPAPRQERLL